MEPVAVVLGRRIRRMRERSGLTQTELAQEVLTSKTRVSEVELGHEVPKLDLLQRLELHLDADGVLTELYELLSLGVQESAVVADAEHDALGITDYESRNVPGLLQTPDYMRANMLAGGVITLKNLEREVSIRVGRQKIIASGSLISGWFIIDESVLHRPCGGSDVMAAQLAKLEEASGLPNVYVQVLPFSVTDAPGYDGPLRVIEYRDKPPIWFTEGRRSGRLSDDKVEVMQALTSLNLLRSAALSVRESAGFIREIREKHYEQ